MTNFDNHFTVLSNMINSYKALNSVATVSALKMLEEVRGAYAGISAEYQKEKQSLLDEIAKLKEENGSLRSETMKRNKSARVVESGDAN